MGNFSHFGPKPVNYLAPYWTQAREENRTPPWGVTSDALRKVYFKSSVPLRHKYTLQRASEIVPIGWCPVFFTCLRPLGCQVVHRFGPNWPKWPRIAQKWSFFQEVTGMLSPIFEKKCGSPPLGHPLGEKPHFFPRFGERVPTAR